MKYKISIAQDGVWGDDYWFEDLFFEDEADLRWKVKSFDIKCNIDEIINQLKSEYNWFTASKLPVEFCPEDDWFVAEIVDGTAGGDNE
jgi:hypothetical protein